jgi:putative hemolysin
MSNFLNLGYIVIYFLVLLFFSAFFSGMEAALLSSSRFKLKSLSEKGSKVAQKILNLKENPERFISPIVLGNNFVNILASVLATYFSVAIAETQHISPSTSLVIVTFVLTIVIVIFGEMIPKSVAAYNPEKFSTSFFYLFSFFWFILFPFSWILSAISKGFLKLFGISPNIHTVFGSPDELRTMLHLSKEEGIIEKSEEKMIFSIFEFGDTLVREVMTPRVDMVTLPANASWEQVLNVIVESNHSRIPVFSGKIDNIVGILYTKDLFKFLKDSSKPFNFRLKDILRPAYFVPETKRVDELFREMQKNKIHISIVFDEYGGVSGLVTMEDLLEEIVGEIQDEYEVDEKNLQKISDNVYLISGMMGIDDFNEKFNVNLSDEEADTIGGIVLEKLGRLPNPGEEVTIDHFKLIPTKIRGRRILQIKVIIDGNKEAK